MKKRRKINVLEKSFAAEKKRKGVPSPGREGKTIERQTGGKKKGGSSPAASEGGEVGGGGGGGGGRKKKKREIAEGGGGGALSLPLIFFLCWGGLPSPLGKEKKKGGGNCLLS